MDHPRLSPTGNMHNKREKIAAADVRMVQKITMEHNRAPGVFDYNYGQNFYSLYPEIDQEAYLTIGSKDTRYAHNKFGNGQVLDKRNAF